MRPFFVFPRRPKKPHTGTHNPVGRRVSPASPHPRPYRRRPPICTTTPDPCPSRKGGPHGAQSVRPHKRRTAKRIWHYCRNDSLWGREKRKGEIIGRKIERDRCDGGRATVRTRGDPMTHAPACQFERRVPRNSSLCGAARRHRWARLAGDRRLMRGISIRRESREQWGRAAAAATYLVGSACCIAWRALLREHPREEHSRGQSHVNTPVQGKIIAPYLIAIGEYWPPARRVWQTRRPNLALTGLDRGEPSPLPRTPWQMRPRRITCI
ncbi:hypothetical protein PHLGIDRAFT_360890 [Phlebiopsis gigantea 11061_1 CR5-6]|uniref:Uncharacterized protein n=1 Tax=Phlebiopsis gigantea (strain 11061_1 CR5-6) TaxID=745531 RepID=A0A0C3S193_PHLG1|nr:hypothetical protein PHLGIDRAFT_360890 [Phlebiopsis gigantea 11061_1 CR5-6]